MTRAVWTAALGALLAGSAAAFDLPSLYVPGLGLAALSAGAAGWVELAVRGARLDREPGPATVMEDEPYELTLDVRPGRVPLPGGMLAVGSMVERAIPLGARRVRHVAAVARFARRGRRALPPVRMTLSDPLGLATRTLEIGASEVLVLPRVEPLEVDGLGRAPGGREAGARGAAADPELDSLRPHQPGAPAARIHWPTFARTGQMMERRLVGDADSRPVVVLDTSDPVDADALDRAVRAAASICLALARTGGCATFLPGDRRPTRLGPDLHAWPALHARLALVEATASARRLPAAMGDRSVFLVTARRDAARSDAIAGRGGERYVVAAGADRRPSEELEVAWYGVRRIRSAGRTAA